MRPLAALIMALCCSACAGQAQDGFGGDETTWSLVTLDGAAFDANATLTVSDQGRIAGNAPCNAYFGTLTRTYPAFEVPVIGSSKRACPDLAAESQFFATLNAVKRAERAGDTLTLSDDTGPRLVFTRAD